jgi:hypothetical protein
MRRGLILEFAVDEADSNMGLYSSVVIDKKIPQGP